MVRNGKKNKKIKKIIIFSILIPLILFFTVGGLMAYSRQKLMDALRANDLAKVEELLKRDVNPNKKTTLIDIWPFSIESGGEYPILEAARNHHIWYDGLKLMVKYGGNVNLRKDETPLTAACDGAVQKKNTLEVVKFLVENGADINLTQKWDGCSPIQVVFNGSSERDVRQEVFFYLVENGAKIDVLRPKDNATLLHLAAKSGFVEVAEYLLEQGIDKSLKDKDGKTALEYAEQYERLEIVDLLI